MRFLHLIGLYYYCYQFYGVHLFRHEYSPCTQEASKLKSLAHAIPEIPKRKRFDLLIPEFTSPLGFELLIYAMC
jgi:hypothetical protein